MRSWRRRVAIDIVESVLVARLMKRFFAIDVLACPRCQARMQHIAELHERKTIQDVVAAITRSTGPP